MKHITEKIEQFDTIIIHGHIRPDGDCIGSQYGLMYLIKESFPEKNVYVTGDKSDYLSFIGEPEKISEELFFNALSICVDCPDKERLSDDRIYKSKYIIKIDHHYDSEKYADYEYIDYNATSCTSIITEFYIKFKDELKMNIESATALYTGLLTDSGFFKNSNVTSKTFDIASVLVERGVDLTFVNNSLSLENINTIKFKGYCINNIKLTENGFCYIKIDKNELNRFDIDEETASSFITVISNIKNYPVWALFIETKDNIRIRLRSRGPEINELAQKYNGGGHKMASGAKLNNWLELDSFIKDADKLVKDYKELN